LIEEQPFWTVLQLTVLQIVAAQPSFECCRIEFLTPTHIRRDGRLLTHVSVHL